MIEHFSLITCFIVFCSLANLLHALLAFARLLHLTLFDMPNKNVKTLPIKGNSDHFRLELMPSLLLDLKLWRSL